MGLAKPQIFDVHNYENDAMFPSLEVSASANYQEALKPVVSRVTWRPTGAKNIVISARGNNFFSETQVALGDKTYSEGGGLILKSNQAFDLITTLDALANGPGTVLGRYDIGVPLSNTQLPDFLPKGGVEVQKASLQPSLAGIRKIEIHLQKKASSQQLAEIKLLKETEQSGKYREVHALHVQDLPLEEITKSLNAPETPIISVNGTTLDLPYEISDTTEGGIPHIVIQANVKDSVVSESGGGIVKVSWPFYPQDKWTATYRFYNPDLAFQLTRVSQKSILINRVDGFSFLNGPETIAGKPPCWNLIASDEELPLIPGCSLKPTPKPDSPKPKPATEDKAETHATALCAPSENVNATANPDASMPPYMYLCAPSGYFIAATVDKLPDKVVLVAPNSSTYTLTIPEFKAKDDKVQPVELKQYDSQWIEIKPKDLTTSAPPTTGKKDAGPDLSRVISVEANGKPLNYVMQQDKTPPTDDKAQKSPPPVKSINVEITRELTAKPGTVDIAFHGADNELIGTRQLHITQTEWGNRGDK